MFVPRFVARICALTVFAVVSLSMLVLPQIVPVSARAATEGFMIDYGGWSVGSSLLASGELVYCIEPGAGQPDGAQQAGVTVDTLRPYTIQSFNGTGWAGTTVTTAVTGEPLRRINYVLSQHGQTNEASEAVAVQFAIWLLREQPGEQAMLQHHIAWVEAHGGGAEIARAYVLVEEAYREAAPVPQSAPDAPRIELSERFGSGVVHYSAGTTELTLVGGTFVTGERTVSLPGDTGGTLEWVADLHSGGWQREHAVGVSGRWGMSQLGWPAQLIVYPSEDHVRQTLSWAVGPVSETRSGAFTAAEVMLDAQFRPVLSTAVQRRVLDAPGLPFADTITLGLAVGSKPWPTRQVAGGGAAFFPVRLQGVVYGPFAEAQGESDKIPANAPVAANVELLADQGPGTYEMRADALPTQDGHYYWVWSIAEQLQGPESRGVSLLPVGYQVSDRFGLVAEEHVVRLPRLAATGASSLLSPIVLGGAAVSGLIGLMLVFRVRRRA